MATKQPEHLLRLCIRMIGPPAGVQFCVQGRPSELVGTVVSTGEDLSFDVDIRTQVSGDGVRFLGPFAQGPPSGRFLYICAGTCAGQMDSRWTRRAKIPLSSITAAMVKMVLESPGGMLEAQINGTAKDGGPACATVLLLGGGWKPAV